jgi:hypothetical protein
MQSESLRHVGSVKYLAPHCGTQLGLLVLSHLHREVDSQVACVVPCLAQFFWQRPAVPFHMQPESALQADSLLYLYWQLRWHWDCETKHHGYEQLASSGQTLES